MMAMEQGLRQALSRRRKRHIVAPSRALSAVLLLIYHKQGEYYLLVTRRTQQVREHKGQISFPGGAYQEGDGTLLDTALRESAEEIGVVPEAVEVLGELDDAVTQTSNYVISPFVGVIPWPYEFRVSASEIAEIIDIPLSALLDRNCWREEVEFIAGERVPAYFYRYRGDVIWGATARILNQFRDILRPVMGRS